MRLDVWLVGLVGVGCAPKAPSGLDAQTETATATVDPNAARAVLEASADELDVSVRRLALETLVQLSPPDRVAGWADRGLWDPSPYVQRAVIDALTVRLPEPVSQQRLQGFVRRDGLDPYSRCAAASRLAARGDDSTLSAVQNAYQQEPALWRAAPCALAAAQMGDADGRARLKAALEQGALPLDAGFLSDVGQADLGEDVAASLAVGLERLEPELELAAAAALVVMGESAGEPLLRRALSSEQGQRQMEAVDFLLELPEADAARLLRRANGADAKVAARLGLVYHGLEEPYFAVESLLAGDREVRALATRALGGWLETNGSSGSRKMIRFSRQGLAQALADPEEVVQIEAARALRAVGRPDDATAVAPLLEADSDQLRIEAAAALLRLTADAP